MYERRKERGRQGKEYKDEATRYYKECATSTKDEERGQIPAAKTDTETEMRKRAGGRSTAGTRGCKARSMANRYQPIETLQWVQRMVCLLAMTLLLRFGR